MDRGTVREATSIIEQLLKFTNQIISRESDSGVDIVTLSQASSRRMEDFKKLLPDGFKKAGESDLLMKGTRLLAQTRLCTEILEKERYNLAGQLESLAKMRRAAAAYSA